jgi:hypothetical protein
MTINSEIKEKLRKADLEHHRKLKRQETIQFIKGAVWLIMDYCTPHQ